MQILLSPSKTISISEKRKGLPATIPAYVNKAGVIVDKLKRYNTNQLAKLMATSQKLSQLTYDRYQFWNIEHNSSNSNQAILSFKGDVFTGLEAQSLENDDLEFLNERLFILSGLYGTLRPFDLIQPYRLEVAHKLAIGSSVNLYNYWREIVTDKIGKAVENDVLVNLASNEYYKMLNTKMLVSSIISPIFKVYKNGSYKVVSVYAKRARGLMTRYIIENRISNPADMKFFDYEGYLYNKELSEGGDYIFTKLI